MSSASIKESRSHTNSKHKEKAPTQDYMIYSIGNGIVSPLAWTTEENFRAVLQGKSSLRHYEHKMDIPEPFFASLFDRHDIDDAFAGLPQQTREQYTPVEKIAILAARQAIRQADIDASGRDVLFVLSSTKGNVDLLEENPYEAERVYLWRSAQLIAEYFGNPNQPVTVSNACISGCAAQLTARNALLYGDFKYAVVIGAEMLSKFIISGFQSFKALSPQRCKPFDADRCGLNLGEAAAAIVYTAGNYDETPSCECHTGALMLQNGAINNDANHISGPSRTAEGLLRSVTKCLQGFDPKSVAFINAHGTATRYNDDMESVAVHRAALQHKPVNSLKGYFGHTLGAAGILEVLVSAAALQQHCVLKSLGADTPGTVQPLNIPMQNTPSSGNAFIKLISGFGGCNAALLFTINNH